jgi:hypothetical protein
MKDKLNIKTSLRKLQAYTVKARRYSFVTFIVFVAVVYGFVLLRINSLRAAEPTPDQVSAQVRATRAPRIDENVVKQLKALEDNSVSVKALFDEARSNPFQ